MFGIKFKDFHSQQAAQRVADSLASSGEIVLVGTPAPASQACSEQCLPSP